MMACKENGLGPCPAPKPIVSNLNTSALPGGLVKTQVVCHNRRVSESIILGCG